MLSLKYPRSIIKELKSLYSDFNSYVIKNNGNEINEDLKLLKKKFKILSLEPNISVMMILLIKHHYNIPNTSQFNKIFLITELYYIGFTLHLNVQNSLFYSEKLNKNTESEIKTYQVLIGDFLFTKIFEIILSVKNHKILTLFAEYNKKISEGMLKIKSVSEIDSQNLENIEETYLDIYGSFVKLCFESIAILYPDIKNKKYVDVLSKIERIFSELNLYRNLEVYKLINPPKKFQIKNSMSKLKLNDKNFDCYIDNLIARM